MSLHDVVSRIVSVLHAHGHLIDEERDQFLAEIGADNAAHNAAPVAAEPAPETENTGFAHIGYGYQQLAPPQASASATVPGQPVNIPGAGSGSD